MLFAEAKTCRKHIHKLIGYNDAKVCFLKHNKKHGGGNQNCSNTIEKLHSYPITSHVMLLMKKKISFLLIQRYRLNNDIYKLLFIVCIKKTLYQLREIEGMGMRHRIEVAENYKMFLCQRKSLNVSLPRNTFNYFKLELTYLDV